MAGDSERWMGEQVVALITAGLDDHDGLMTMLVNEFSETEAKRVLVAMSHWAAFLITQMYEDPFEWTTEIGKFVKTFGSDLPPDQTDDKL